VLDDLREVVDGRPIAGEKDLPELLAADREGEVVGLGGALALDASAPRTRGTVSGAPGASP